MGKYITVNTSVLEIIVFLLLVLYLLIPVETPEPVLSFATSSLGMVITVLLVLYLILYSHPILAIVTVIAAFEFFRRNSNAEGKAAKHVSFDLSQDAKDKKMKKMNPPQEKTLEESVIGKMAPIKNDIIATTFAPVMDNLHHAMSL